MFGKWLLSAVLMLGVSAGAFAGDFVGVDLNYWCRGTLKLLTAKLPAGVTVSGRNNYSQKKFAHICYYRIVVDLEKTQEFELEFEVTGVGDKADTAKLVPSAAPMRKPKDGKKPVIECLEFECFDESAENLPCKITAWKAMFPAGIILNVGDKFKIKGKFKSLTK